MNIEQLNGKWITRKWWNEDYSSEEIQSINEAEMFISDFSLWATIKESGVCENFKMQYGDDELIYTLWYEGILQYVGKSHCFSRRMWQHFNGNGKEDATYNRNEKEFDEIRYVKVPTPWPCYDFNIVIEKELMTRYNLIRNSNGYIEKRNYQPNYIRTSMNYLNSKYEQLSFF
jgi:hypothetical protein|tara:strand:- start:370 stop:888 length:519 start_codon:yes stop_codon:yes gene_type:complete